MKKTIKDLFKLITAIATVAGILYVARDQIKAIIAKIKEVSDDDFDDDFDDESFDDDSFDDDSFDNDEIFPEPSKDDRDYVSINITDTDDDDPSVVEEESQETETPSEESDEKE
jgi:DNA-directed RNA polymerase subunit delta